MREGDPSQQSYTSRPLNRLSFHSIDDGRWQPQTLVFHPDRTPWVKRELARIDSEPELHMRLSKVVDRKRDEWSASYQVRFPGRFLENGPSSHSARPGSSGPDTKLDRDVAPRALADHGVEGRVRMRDSEVPEVMFSDPDNLSVQIQDVSHGGGAGTLRSLLICFLPTLFLVGVCQLPTAAQERRGPPQPSSDLDEPSGSDEPGTVAAVSATMSAGGATVLDRITGPPPPMAPEVVTRDAVGRATVRAIRLTRGIRLDGQLDEQIYRSVPAITGLVQQVPDEGAPATERTEAWIMFDEDNVYVAARVWDSAPPSEWVANEMRRDTVQLRQNDNFGVLFDTYYDHRNGFFFYTTPLGALADQQFTNEGNPNQDWNPVWDVRTGRFEGGWTVEMEIPFKSLRYRSAPTQLWGLQLRRLIRRKNEHVYLTPVPISLGPSGVYRVSGAATLVGLQVPGTGRNLEIKPYGVGGVSTDLEAEPPRRNDGNGDFGVDVKFGVTQSLTADLTYNTDFAQVEVDEQQVNLTRFSLFFPEKREFFLEGQGIFEFAQGSGGGSRGGGGGGGGGGGFFFGGGGGRTGGRNVPTMFFSRRIGLEDGEIVPVVAGGRVTGKVGAFDVGALNIQTGDVPTAGIESTNFTALRLKRDILRRSTIGGIFTNRSVSLLGNGPSQAYGIDGAFSFYENVEIRTYYAKTKTPQANGRDTSYYGRFDYRGDRYELESTHLFILFIEENFVPEVGFVRRDKRWTPSFGQVFVTAKVESPVHDSSGVAPGLLFAPWSVYASSGVRSLSDEWGRRRL